MRGLTCPWCGRVVVVRKDGTLPVHKGNERTLLGKTRLYCSGEGKNPDTLTATERVELKREWRDSDGFRRIVGAA